MSQVFSSGSPNTNRMLEQLCYQRVLTAHEWIFAYGEYELPELLVLITLAPGNLAKSIAGENMIKYNSTLVRNISKAQKFLYKYTDTPL